MDEYVFNTAETHSDATFHWPEVADLIGKPVTLEAIIGLLKSTNDTVVFHIGEPGVINISHPNDW